MFFENGYSITTITNVILAHNTRPKGQSVSYGRYLSHNELIYKCNGSSIIRFGKQVINLSQGVLLLLPKGHIDGEYIVETISPGYAIDIHHDTLLEQEIGAHTLVLGDTQSTESLFVKILHEWSSNHVARQTRCMAIAYHILAEIIEFENKLSITHLDESRLSPVLSFLEQHYTDRRINYENLAKMAGVSYAYFKRIFIKRHGMPPSRYVTTMRMARARSLLLETQESISTVSNLLGYDNQYYFSRVFRKEHGVSPSEYRAKHNTL